MCGLAGYYCLNKNQKVEKEELMKMTKILAHRGPDDEGTFISQDKKVGLGSRRLKIIDLSNAGHMPMAVNYQPPHEDFKVWIVYNGEIYNFLEIKKELIKKGYQFKSKTDTEVILNSYLEWGPECLKKFNGMFAFVIFDEYQKILFAARDHLGIKPFYYALQNKTFYFASEIKAILAHKNFKKELAPEGLSFYLSFGACPAPWTMFKNIQKLPAAHYLIIKNQKIEIKEYWQPLKQQNFSYEKEDFYLENIRNLLKKSIKNQMISDVPFGCFLSGGIDSSTNAALMSEALKKPVETFSVGSYFEKYNEFFYSRKIAKLLNAKNHEIIIGDYHFYEFLNHLAPYYLDDLNSDYICLPLFYLAQLTRKENVVVVQIGEGSDEIFAGYQTYLKAYNLYKNWWQKLEKIPKLVTLPLWYFTQLLPFGYFDFQKEYLQRLTKHQEPFWGLAIAFSDYQKEKLLNKEFLKQAPLQIVYEFIKKIYQQVTEIDPKADFLKKITYLEIKNRLPELLLARADKMTMANSIEGRVPFLDKELVTFALNLPVNIKLKNQQPKYLLKKSVENILPKEIVWRKKQGFSTPMNEWLNLKNQTGKDFIKIILTSKIKERNIFNQKYLEKFIYLKKYQDNSHIFRLWNLGILSRWYDFWFG